MKKFTALGTVALTALSCQAIPSTHLQSPQKQSQPNSFTYEISAYGTLNSDEETSAIETEKGKMLIKRKQITVALKDEKHLERFLKKHGMRVVAQVKVPSAPARTWRDEDGQYHDLPASGFVTLPRYLMEYNPDLADSLDGFETRANKLKIKGHFKFKSREDALVLNKALEVELETDEGVNGSGLNYYTGPSSTTIEGAPVSATSSYQSSPNLADFWWVGREGYYGALINTTNADATINYAQGTGIKVAVIDSGYYGFNEPAVPGSIVANSNYFYFNGINSAQNIQGPSTNSGAPWHGRVVSSLIFAPWNDGHGTIGTAPNATKLLCKTDYWSFANDQCLNTAINWGARVINMSYGSLNFLGGTSFDASSIKRAYNNNIVMVAASGNNFTDYGWYPSAYPEVLGIGATDRFGTRPNWVNAANVDLWAPGIEIAYASEPNDLIQTYRVGNGTSLAAPIVSGVVACMMQNVNVTNVSNYTTARSWLRSKADQFPVGPVPIGTDNLALNAMRSIRGY